jgi:triacylglycerol lipase
MARVVVLVTGGGCNCPFTTPERGCTTGLAAGGQLTALRAAVLDAGFPAYTCPARVGGGIMDADAGWGGFADGPSPLPAEMTIDSVASVRESGERLARFISYLSDDVGVTEVDLIGYSLGGVIGRDAIGRLQRAEASVRVRSLTSVATPWLGSFVLLHDPTALPLPQVIANFVGSFIGGVDSTVSSVPRDRTPRPPVWAQGYDHILEGLSLTRIAGTYFPEGPIDGDFTNGVIEANDGFCTRTSALALGADPIALPPATCFEVPDLHSNLLADLIDEPWERGVNWDPITCAIVVEALHRSRND